MKMIDFKTKQSSIESPSLPVVLFIFLIYFVGGGGGGIYKHVSSTVDPPPLPFLRIYLFTGLCILFGGNPRRCCTAATPTPAVCCSFNILYIFFSQFHCVSLTSVKVDVA